MSLARNTNALRVVAPEFTSYSGDASADPRELPNQGNPPSDGGWPTNRNDKSRQSGRVIDALRREINRRYKRKGHPRRLQAIRLREFVRFLRHRYGEPLPRSARHVLGALLEHLAFVPSGDPLKRLHGALQM
jgi:hypothetical protein